MGGPLLRSALRAGAIGGIVVIYLAVVGMIERLDGLVIIGNVGMDTILILLPAAVVGWVVARPRVVGGERRVASPAGAAAGGATAGLAAGVVVELGLLLVSVLGIETVRQVFIAVSPTLIEIMRFHMEPVPAAIVMIVSSTAVGALGGALRVLPKDVRTPIASGLAAIVVVALLQRVISPAFDQVNVEQDWLYSKVTSGLTWIGGAVVYALTAAAVRFHVGKRLVAILLPTRYGRPVAGPATASAEAAGGADEAEAEPRDRRTSLEGGISRRGLAIVAWCVIAVIVAFLPYLVGPVVSRILGTVGIFLLLGLGLNIVVGLAGLLDLGYVAFFAVGAYFTAILTGGQRVTFTGYEPPTFGLGLSFYVALPIVIAIAALVGVIIGAPVLRLRGDYLAIVTLGFGEIARVIFGSTWAQNLFGGSLGMSGITTAAIPGVPMNFQADPRHFYLLVLVFCLLAVFVSWRLQGSRVGRAWNAMREDEQVADAMGISTTRFKLLAFAMGGAIGSVGGALFAVSLGSLTIASFQILVSITALAVIILGGLGSIPGVVVGALVLIGLPGLLTQFEDYRLLIYGAVLIAIMLLRPQGLVPNVRVSRELQEDERSQDQWAKHLLEQDAADAPEPTGGALT
ncbi:MAG: branched-chain amino acid ABC transporter permease [Actinomycetota bacterium]